MSSHKFSGNLDQFTAAFHTDDEGLEHRCLNGKDKIIVNHIIDWSDNDVWSFIRNYLNIPYCKLYDEGFHRLGCLLCPMASAKRKREELQRYPNIKNAYLRVIEFIGKERRSKGGKNLILSEADNEEVLEWYISGKSARKFIEDKKQLKLKFEDNDELSRFLQGRPTLKELNEKYPAEGRFNSDGSKDFDESFIENMAKLSRSNITLYETDKLKELVEGVEKAISDNKD